MKNVISIISIVIFSLNCFAQTEHTRIVEFKVIGENWTVTSDTVVDGQHYYENYATAIGNFYSNPYTAKQCDAKGKTYSSKMFVDPYSTTETIFQLKMPYKELATELRIFRNGKVEKTFPLRSFESKK